MLSTPPAFVLSQDQTLYKMVSTQAFQLELIFHRAISIASCFASESVIDLTRSLSALGRFFRTAPSGAFRSLRCLIYKVHAVLLGGSPLIIHHLIPFVKHFFQSFLTPGQRCIVSNFFSLPHPVRFVKNFFQKLLNSRFRYLSGNSHRVPHLVAAVKCFFLSLAGAVLTAPTAQLEYQILPHLSTLFHNLFSFF